MILIEPGLIKSAFGETAAAHIAVAPGDPYAGFNAAIATDTTRAYQKGLMARLGGSRTTSPASSRRPSPPSTHARYPVTLSARMLIGLRRLLPDAGWDALRRRFPLPGAEPAPPAA